jgi:hypothetical protein
VPYFDGESKNLKQNYNRCLNMFRNYSCNKNKVAMVKARDEYKKQTVRKNKFLYDKDQSKKLENERIFNAKANWKMLRGTVVKNVIL